MGHDKSHASEHTDGTDDVQDATSGQKGLATSAQITKLDTVDENAKTILTGTLGSRPAAGTADRFYWATDNDILYYDNGVTWDTINAEAEAHKDTHDPEDGSDPLDAAAPGSIDENANAEGSAHSFARSDHNHQHLAALHENGGGAEISLAGLDGEPNDTVNESLFDAQTILQATSNDTPVAITIAEQQVVGRITAGNIKGLSIAEMKTLLGFAEIKTGTYTGDGAVSQAITGVGFSPKYVKIWPRRTVDGASTPMFETTDTIVDDNASGMAMVDATNPPHHRSQTNAIIALGADGFTVDDDGGDDHPNRNGITYNYMAIG